jgi:hypothetical protein
MSKHPLSRRQFFRTSSWGTKPEEAKAWTDQGKAAIGWVQPHLLDCMPPPNSVVRVSVNFLGVRLRKAPYCLTLCFQARANNFTTRLSFLFFRPPTISYLSPHTTLSRQSPNDVHNPFSVWYSGVPRFYAGLHCTGHHYTLSILLSESASTTTNPQNRHPA